MPSESDYQSLYDLSRTESKIYRMKCDGFQLSDIADYLGTSVQYVKNTMVSINSKIRDKENHPMHLITINQQNEGVRRKALAMMCLRIIATDQEITELYEGSHTISIFNIKPIVGDVDFVTQNIFTKIDPLPNSMSEARDKANQIYKMYLELGGKRGQMGYGFAKWLFDKFYIKYDMM